MAVVVFFGLVIAVTDAGGKRSLSPGPLVLLIIASASCHFHPKAGV